MPIETPHQLLFSAQAVGDIFLDVWIVSESSSKWSQVRQRVSDQL